jgi:hypothetical protein
MVQSVGAAFLIDDVWQILFFHPAKKALHRCQSRQGVYGDQVRRWREGGDPAAEGKGRDGKEAEGRKQGKRGPRQQDPHADRREVARAAAGRLEVAGRERRQEGRRSVAGGGKGAGSKGVRRGKQAQGRGGRTQVDFGYWTLKFTPVNQSNQSNLFKQCNK